MDYYQSERIANAIKGIASVNEQSMLTKREHFAAMALQGILSNSGNDILAPFEYAHDAVNIADELIAALNKEQSK